MTCVSRLAQPLGTQEQTKARLQKRRVSIRVCSERRIEKMQNYLLSSVGVLVFPLLSRGKLFCGTARYIRDTSGMGRKVDTNATRLAEQKAP